MAEALVPKCMEKEGTAMCSGYRELLQTSLDLRAALKDCADDLEASVKHEYDGVLDYPSMKLKFDRDMQPVLRARELLE